MKLFIAIVAALLLGGSIAHAEPGDPIRGVAIGIEGDPYPVAALQSTDRLGSVVFTDLAPGRYTVFIPDASRLEAPVQIRISAAGPTGRPQTYTIQPGPERAYALDAQGQRLLVTISREGGRIGVNVSSIFDRWGGGPQVTDRATSSESGALQDVTTTRGRAPRPTGDDSRSALIGSDQDDNNRHSGPPTTSAVDMTDLGTTQGRVPRSTGTEVRQGTAVENDPADFQWNVETGRRFDHETGDEPASPTTSAAHIFMKIDTVNTVRACETRQGQVVVHEGIEQCRIPAPEAPAGGNPTREPGRR